MVTKIKKWGNSQGLRFSKLLLEEAQIKVGDEVKIFVRRGQIIIESVSNVRGIYDLTELVSRIPKNYLAEEVKWGMPAGKEVW
ncbi:MAG: transcriptional regulator/antitoxin, MazE [Planctomycetes bacterium]|nr:transcriptional regulator/antitoxin, MazE [Planctomycetota bacterium]